MKALVHTLRLAVLICLAALLLAALPQVGLVLALALLVPIWFLIDFVTAALLPEIDELSEIRLFPSLPVFSPRPPPIS
jgi:hypothetical protein